MLYNTLCIPYISLHPSLHTLYVYDCREGRGVIYREYTESYSISFLFLFFFHQSSLYPIKTSNKNFILKYFRCRDGKRTETRIGMEGICITHFCIPLYTVYMQHIMAHSGGMQEWVIRIPSIPILVSVLFPSLHLKYFRIKFLLLVCSFYAHARETTPTSDYKLSRNHIVVQEGP